MTLRKIVLRADIAGYVRKLTDDMRVLELLELSLGRVLANAGKDGSFVFDLVNGQQATHITDWLTAAVVNDEEWLRNVDENDRPKKLMKFGDVASIVREADKAMAKLANKQRVVTLVEGDEELYAELEDGYHVVRLMTPAALDRETSVMRHCIGGGAYDHKVGTENFDYLSLRDRFGKSLVSMELETWQSRGPRMIQIFAKMNATPTADLVRLLAPMFKERGIRLGQVGDIVFGKDWTMHDIRSLPSEFSLWGSLEIRDIGNLVLPEKLRVEGDLSIEGCQNLNLPDYLRVDGDMYLHGSSVVNHAEEMAIGRDLSLVSVETMEIGIAESLRMTNLRAASVPTWTQIGSVYFKGFATMSNCGVGEPDMYRAREEMLAAGAGSRPMPNGRSAPSGP